LHCDIHFAINLIVRGVTVLKVTVSLSIVPLNIDAAIDVKLPDKYVSY